MPEFRLGWQMGGAKAAKPVEWYVFHHHIK